MPNTSLPIIIGVTRVANEGARLVVSITTKGNLVGRLAYEKRYLYNQKFD